MIEETVTKIRVLGSDIQVYGDAVVKKIGPDQYITIKIGSEASDAKDRVILELTPSVMCGLEKSLILAIRIPAADLKTAIERAIL